MVQPIYADIAGSLDQGYNTGRQRLTTQLAGQAINAQGDDRQAAMSQLASVNPGGAMALNGQFQQQAQQAQSAQHTQDVNHAAKVNGAANFMLQAIQTKDPARIQGAWQSVKPYLEQLTGKTAPDQYDPAMLPGIYQAAGQSGGVSQGKTNILSAGAALTDNSGHVLYSNPASPKPHLIQTANGSYVWATPGQGAQPVTYGGGQAPQPQQTPQAGGAQDPMTPIIAQANEMSKQGIPDAQIQQFIQQQAQQTGIQMGPPGAEPQQGAPQATPAAGIGPGAPVMGPQKSAGVPSGYRFKADGSGLEPIPGGPADPDSTNLMNLTPDALKNSAWDVIMSGKMPPLGRSKESLAARGKIMNAVADIAKQAGVSPQDLATQPGRVKALQSSLQNLQKQSDVMEKSEATFQNNANILLNLSDQVSRSGVPAFNQFLLHVKTNYAGDPNAASFLAARNLVAQEYAKIASNATGAAGSSDTAQSHALSLINTAQTPDQLRLVIQTLGKDIDGQKQATEQQLLNISGRMQEFGMAKQYTGNAYHQPAQPQQTQPQQAQQPGDFSHLWGN